MKIYTFKPLVGEKNEKAFVDTTKDTVPLAVDIPEGPSPRSHVVVTRTYTNKRCINLILLVIALLVLAAGIVGGVYLYKHLTRKYARGVCGVTVHDEMKPTSESFYFEEDIEVREEIYEEIQVPKFDECEQALVLHDFGTNYTAFVDEDTRRCFTMKLDRSVVAPPRDLVELIRRVRSNYYIPRASVLRKKYHVVSPPVKQLRIFGPFIANKCFTYDTYRLERITGDVVVKRSTDQKMVHYGYYAFKEKVVVLDIML